MPPTRTQMALTEELVALVERIEPDPGPAPGIADPTEDELHALAAGLLEAHLPEPLWLFAYGSLIWKPEVEHIEHVPATATGWHRRFCMQPDDFASRRTLLREFETVARAVLGDDADASRFAATGAALDVKTMAVRPRYTGVPAGARTHPKGYWTPDRPMMVDLVARTWHIRSRRWDPIDQVVADP